MGIGQYLILGIGAFFTGYLCGKVFPNKRLAYPAAFTIVIFTEIVIMMKG